MSNKLPLLSRILKSVYELLRVVTSFLQIPASYLLVLAIDYELAINVNQNSLISLLREISNRRQFFCYELNIKCQINIQGIIFTSFKVFPD